MNKTIKITDTLYIVYSADVIWLCNSLNITGQRIVLDREGLLKLIPKLVDLVSILDEVEAEE